MLRPGVSSLSLKPGDSSLDVRAVSSEQLNDKLYLLVNSNHEITANQLRTPEINHETTNVSKIQIIYTPENSIDTEIKLYAKRWLILFIFSSISLLSAFNWIEYNIVQDVVIFYYNQSLPDDQVKKIDAVNWFSMVYMLCYIPLVFPAMFLLERKGLKLSCSIGAFLTLLGSLIKCFAVNPNLFYLAMTGQTFCAIGQAFTLGIPARLSALWFGPNEIGLATSIGVFGNQLGTAIGFVVPPRLVHKKDPVDVIEKNFYSIFITVAVLCAIFFILSLIFVSNQPVKAPSRAQLEVRKSAALRKDVNDFDIFKESLKNLFKNFDYILVLVSYGVNTGVYYSISTLLNLIISNYYENENENIGLIGLILVASGLIGAVVCGFVLDRTKQFKYTTLVIYVSSFLAMIIFSLTLQINIWLIFWTTFLLGFFMTGYLPVGFELAAEVTYPVSEGTSCGLLNSSAQIFGILFTYTQGRIIISYGSFYGNVFLIAMLLIGTILTALVRQNFKRQEAIKMALKEIEEHEHC
ncbi:feline leukemia virus subgroup C receptor-related 1 [Brachionus plicatilis]|uniref:Feline leukemia virus subgroup C receptor-related 1 n=1 Tax=Brachionus plicatilis TaxID=10195 RepID=A0A3M7S7Q6_BRAPC|nr:feline leukemia virus subgroup C receptor-related 1 [Brachionus plicatilis]